MSNICVLCNKTVTKDEIQELSLLPSNLINHYKSWFGKDLDIKIGSKQNTAKVCHNCFVRYSRNQHTMQLDILSKWWGTHEVKNDLLSLCLLHGRKLSYLIRFAGALRLHEESVAEHSYWVALLSFAISQKYFKNENINIENMFITAMFHDWAEILTSDVITPLKSKISKLYEDVEGSIIDGLAEKINFPSLNKLMLDFNTQSSLEGIIVALADKLSCYMYIKEEYLLGSQTFTSVLLEKVLRDMMTIGISSTYADTIKQVISDSVEMVNADVSRT